MIGEMFRFYYDSFFHATDPPVKLDLPAVLNKYVFSKPPTLLIILPQIGQSFQWTSHLLHEHILKNDN